MNFHSTSKYESPESFGSLIDNSPIGIILVNQKGIMLLANPYAERIFGYNERELTGQPIEMLIPKSVRKSHRDKHAEYFKSPIDRPMGQGLDLYARKKNGKEFPVEISLGNYEMNGEKMAIAYVTDITIRKARRENYRNLFDNSVTGVYTWDILAQEPVDINAKGLEMFGYATKTEFFETYHAKKHFANWEDREHLIKTIQEKGSVEHLEMEMKKKDGTPFWVLLFCKLNSDGRILQSVMIDITGRKQAEEKYRGLFENSLMAAFIADMKSNRLIDANQKAYELFGYHSKEEFLEKFNLSPAIHFVDPEDWKRVIEVVESGNEVNGDFELMRLDGTTFWAEMFAKENTEQRTIQIILADVTESKRFHEELEAKVKDRTLELTSLLEREKGLSDMKSRFVSVASHEFRTPLSTILSSLYLVEAYHEEKQKEKRNHHIQRIKSSVKNLTTLLDDFLSLDKLEQSKIEIAKETFNVKDFLNDVLEELSSILKAGQKIIFEYAGEKDIIQDKRILRNVILNLISNASKYSIEDREIHVSCEVRDHTVSISVKDEGIGIPEPEQKKMFERFFRAKNATNISGTGLGLNIVKRYMELMGGSIHFTSELGKGTTFIIEFPSGYPNAVITSS